MKKVGVVLVLLVLAVGAGFVMARRTMIDEPKPEAPALIERIREVAKLQTLDVTVSKTVEFQPDPPRSTSAIGDVLNWAVWTVKTPSGRAIVFGTAHLSFDLSQLDASSLRAQGDVVELVLPPLKAALELDPSRTEVISSNLDSSQTAALLAKAKGELEMDVGFDKSLRAKARVSAEKALEAFLKGAGFREVRFVERLAVAQGA